MIRELLSLAHLVTFAHLVFACTWIGGTIYMNLVLIPALAVLDPRERGKLLGAAAKRFSILAWVSVLGLLGTGLVKMPAGAFLDLSSPVGRILGMKHAFFSLMVIFGLTIAYGLAPKLRSLAPKVGEAPSPAFVRTQKLITFLSWTNLGLGIAVLFVISLV